MPIVRTKNFSGQVAELQVDADMVDTLQGKVRRDELASVAVVGDDSPDLVEVPVPYRPRPAALVDMPIEPVVVIDERHSAPGQVVPTLEDALGDATPEPRPEPAPKARKAAAKPKPDEG